ncbi:hypothetical protein B0H14DRAFT_3426481 [Mycena olivaceomarginata]|nr:hypothetical protein B0H14DRAFT_3426481 [Mycena olivaceomarginata]
MCAGRCFLFVCALISCVTLPLPFGFFKSSRSDPDAAPGVAGISDDKSATALPPRLSDTSELLPSSIAVFSDNNDGTSITSALSSRTTVIGQRNHLRGRNFIAVPHPSPPGPNQSAHHMSSSSLAIILVSVFLVLLCTVAVVVGCLSCRRARSAPPSRAAQRAAMIAMRPRYQWFVPTSASSASSVATMTTAAPAYTPRPPSYASAARRPWSDTASVQTDRGLDS